jgi:hypothetical protein
MRKGLSYLLHWYPPSHLNLFVIPVLPRLLQNEDAGFNTLLIKFTKFWVQKRRYTLLLGSEGSWSLAAHLEREDLGQQAKEKGEEPAPRLVPCSCPVTHEQELHLTRLQRLAG